MFGLSLMASTKFETISFPEALLDRRYRPVMNITPTSIKALVVISKEFSLNISPHLK
jgi:hypothetical protein